MERTYNYNLIHHNSCWFSVLNTLLFRSRFIASGNTWRTRLIWSGNFLRTSFECM